MRFDAAHDSRGRGAARTAGGPAVAAILAGAAACAVILSLIHI